MDKAPLNRNFYIGKTKSSYYLFNSKKTKNIPVGLEEKSFTCRMEKFTPVENHAKGMRI